MRAGLALVILGLLGGCGWLLWVQNSARTAALSFDVGIAAWQTAAPVPVLGWMGGSLAVGLLIGAVAGWWTARPRSRGSDAPYGDARPW